MAGVTSLRIRSIVFLGVGLGTFLLGMWANFTTGIVCACPSAGTGAESYTPWSGGLLMAVGFLLILSGIVGLVRVSRARGSSPSPRS
jgi:hypothetical protein